MKDVAVIICAAGASARFGGKKKKPFVEVAGRAAFQRSIEFFANRDDVKQVILAISPDDEELVKVKWGPNLSFSGVKICLGGKQRFETVAKALDQVSDNIDLVAVHDSVRCCLTDKWIDDVFQLASEKQAAMLACPVVPTLKRVENGAIIDTIDRTGLFEAQTPQVFDADLLRRAYANLENVDTSTISDDSGLVEALGEKVWIVETDRTNLKITKKSDVTLAEAIIKARPKPKPDGPTGPYIEAQW
jgi:2-C-methyl-D-erythritol 4-phosphate cytidylyltransferase